MTYFRVTPQQDELQAFDGIGASLYPGRWNDRNERAVYLSTTLPLAILEIMVQDTVTNLQGYGFYPVTIADDIALLTVDRSTLPTDWRTGTPGRDHCRAAAAVTRRGRTPLGVVVPSAVIPEAFDFGDFNVVLDPRSPEFKKLTIDAWRPLDIDPRVRQLVREP